MMKAETSLFQHRGDLGDGSDGSEGHHPRKRSRTALRKSFSTPLFGPTGSVDSVAHPSGVLSPPIGFSGRSTTSASPTDTYEAGGIKDAPTLTSTQRISRAKKGKRVHGCTYEGCGKIFTRAEHLRRHQLNHSTDVHYKCDICDKTFVRQDLLTRHTERHAIQTQKAVQTLEVAQRHRLFSSQFGIQGITVITTTPQSSVEFSGVEPSLSSPHPISTHSHVPPPIMTAIMPGNHQGTLSHHSLPPSSATSMSPTHLDGSATPYSSSYTPGMAITHAINSSFEYISADSINPLPTDLKRSHLPFHLQHSEPPRPVGYIPPATPQLEAPAARSDSKARPTRSTPTWDHYRWLLDESSPDHCLRKMNMTARSEVASMIHPLEAQHHLSVSLGYDPTNNLSSPSPHFHKIGENQRSRLFKIFGGSPFVHEGNSSPNHFTKYLSEYWKIFHPLMPIMHRATFLPHRQPDYLVAIVLAMGASYGNSEEKRFAYAVHDIVRRWILHSDEYATTDPDSLSIRQLVFLTDIFGKMRVPEGDIHDTELEIILIDSIRRTPIMSDDILDIVRGFLQEGIQFNAQTEWRTWVDLESKKRMALYLFFWDIQQYLLWGRDPFHSVFDVKVHMPCNGYVWALDTPTEWVKGLDGQPESVSFLECLKSYIDPHREPLVPSIHGTALTLYGFMALGREMQLRRSPHSLIPALEELSDKQVKLFDGLECCRQKFELKLKPVLIEPWFNKILAIYHVVYIRLHINVNALLAAAGDPRFIDGDTGDQCQAEQEIQMWAMNTPASQMATWHAIQILRYYFRHPDLYRKELYATWCVYLATLVCWGYGKFTPATHDEPLSQHHGVFWNPEQEKDLYLAHMGSGDSWHTLHENRGMCRRTAGLITCVIRTLDDSGWMYVQKGMQVLKSLIGRPMHAV